MVSILLQVPKLRSRTYSPTFLELRRPAEKAIAAMISQVCFRGVSTRKVDDLMVSVGLTGIDKHALVAVQGTRSPGFAAP